MIRYMQLYTYVKPILLKNFIDNISQYEEFYEKNNDIYNVFICKQYYLCIKSPASTT